MIRSTTHTNLVLSLSAVGLLVACGASPEYEADLEVKSPREARVKVTAALDLSSLVDQEIATRLVIENIQLNLADVRLLGADPRIPAGGYGLLQKNQIVRLEGTVRSALELPFPEYFASQDDLAVYLRIDPAEELEWSSVVVSGRLYAEPLESSIVKYLTADEEGAQDPDGDPCMEGAQDPDGDPARCSMKKGLVGRALPPSQSIAFELRGQDVTDLVATLDEGAELDVVVGIPASRWFTPEMVAELDRALKDVVLEDGFKRKGESKRAEVIVIEPGQHEAADRAHAKRERMRERGDGYFVGSPDRLDDLTIRRP